jgi:3-oxoacyl-[acyl-carrier-protein] synthase-3
MKYGAYITGTGSAFPQQRVTNEDIVTRLKALDIDTSDQWIRERTGMCERRHSQPGNAEEHNSSLGLKASLAALEMAGKTPADIDQIIYATCSPDAIILSTACLLQHKLGAKKAWAMDINAACSGFLYGLTTAEQFIQSGKSQTVLVVGAEVLSPFINWEDRSSCILFGDGAGAAVVERTASDAQRRILSTHVLSDGDLWELLYVPAGGSNIEVTEAVIAEKLHKVRMSGKEIFKVAVRTLEEFAHKAMAANGVCIDDIDWFIPHQANRRIIEAVVKRLAVPDEKVMINVDRFGNTSAATVPTVLDQGVRSGQIKEGQLLLLDAFGAGLTYGSILMRW